MTDTAQPAAAEPVLNKRTLTNILVDAQEEHDRLTKSIKDRASEITRLQRLNTEERAQLRPLKRILTAAKGKGPAKPKAATKKAS